MHSFEISQINRFEEIQQKAAAKVFFLTWILPRVWHAAVARFWRSGAARHGAFSGMALEKMLALWWGAGAPNFMARQRSSLRKKLLCFFLCFFVFFLLLFKITVIFIFKVTMLERNFGSAEWKMQQPL